MPHKNLEERREYHRSWAQTNRERSNAIKKAYITRNKPMILLKKKCKRYGITPEEYVALEMKADGHCMSCGEHFGKRGPATDHNHETGKVRGLICDGCNTCAGAIESPRYLKVLKYLKEHGDA